MIPMGKMLLGGSNALAQELCSQEKVCPFQTWSSVLFRSTISAVQKLKPGDDWQKLGTHTYGASKALAEKGKRQTFFGFSFSVYCLYPVVAAWDFVKKNEHRIGWGLSIICPSIVSGPTSSRMIY